MSGPFELTSVKNKVSVYFGKEVLVLTFMILNKIMDNNPVIL